MTALAANIEIRLMVVTQLIGHWRDSILSCESDQTINGNEERRCTSPQKSIGDDDETLAAISLGRNAVQAKKRRK